MYPFAQSIFPEITDNETVEKRKEIFTDFTKGKESISWKGRDTLSDIKNMKFEEYNIEIEKISSVCDMQFGRDSSKALLKGKIEIVKSKKTDKIRNIYSNKKHILSMRAKDGLFTLKIQGGKNLHKNLKKPKLRVIVDKDAAPFVMEGKSVFAKFVIDCDPELRPLDECLIVDEKDGFLAVGRCLMNRSEMLSFNYGIAVKTRETQK
jgi:7-cyano-7-deazaguanine tRNA-ribosyltransferase